MQTLGASRFETQFSVKTLSRKQAHSSVATENLKAAMAMVSVTNNG